MSNLSQVRRPVLSDYHTLPRGKLNEKHLISRRFAFNHVPLLVTSAFASADAGESPDASSTRWRSCARRQVELIQDGNLLLSGL